MWTSASLFFVFKLFLHLLPLVQNVGTCCRTGLREHLHSLVAVIQDECILLSTCRLLGGQWFPLLSNAHITRKPGYNGNHWICYHRWDSFQVSINWHVIYTSLKAYGFSPTFTTYQLFNSHWLYMGEHLWQELLILTTLSMFPWAVHRKHLISPNWITHWRFSLSVCSNGM